MYSEERADGTKDANVEYELSWLEGAIEPILPKFETAALTGKNPELTDAELLTWRFYMVVQWRRVPDLHKTVATDEESAAYLHEILDHAQAKFPDRAAEIEAMRCPKSVRRTVKNARVSGITEVSGRVMSAMASRGIAVLAITPPQKALIIGSRPVVQLGFRDGLKLMDEATEMWLPISSRVAAGVGTKGSREIVYSLADHAAIRHLNLAIARQSTDFASRSPELTASVARAV